MTLTAWAVRRLKILRLCERLTGSVPLTGLRQVVSVVVVALLRARRAVEPWEGDTGISRRAGLDKGKSTIGHDSRPTKELRLCTEASHSIWVLDAFSVVRLHHWGHGTFGWCQGRGEGG